MAAHTLKKVVDLRPGDVLQLGGDWWLLETIDHTTWAHENLSRLKLCAWDLDRRLPTKGRKEGELRTGDAVYALKQP